jgi:hypothetical protein
MRPYLKKKSSQKRAGRMVQEVGGLPRKSKALSSNSSVATKKKKKNLKNNFVEVRDRLNYLRQP